MFPFPWLPLETCCASSSRRSPPCTAVLQPSGVCCSITCLVLQQKLKHQNEISFSPPSTAGVSLSAIAFVTPTSSDSPH
ncbi:hypothetical protein A2U01_0010599 [Trifolium medium]|uniref:Uncharacterized protein n=1 Tax=Trifolium medium TaxID=97028 RepID=A0A392MRQ2_9FABA|nr:hypothetical protein [Trifolium medium]